MAGALAHSCASPAPPVAVSVANAHDPNNVSMILCPTGQHPTGRPTLRGFLGPALTRFGLLVAPSGFSQAVNLTSEYSYYYGSYPFTNHPSNGKGYGIVHHSVCAHVHVHASVDS